MDKIKGIFSGDDDEMEELTALCTSSSSSDPTLLATISVGVKGLAFHPALPYIVAGLDNGVVQLWNYENSLLIKRLVHHNFLPVRGVDIHPGNEPFVVSGGDDSKLKFWNYMTGQGLFALEGHTNYIRTVEFHPTLPLVVTASDDQTIRIWDYEKRACRSVRTGHTHCVTCASFHPSKNLIVSASMDHTVRVWDTMILFQKVSNEAGFSTACPTAQKDVLADTELSECHDVVIKFKLEGYNQGVNWACFHPTQPLVAFASDDGQVKLWHPNEAGCQEEGNFLGHTSNARCCIFRPQLNLVVSAGEDDSIRAWDIAQRLPAGMVECKGRKFSIIAGHMNRNLLVAGHDSGFFVFGFNADAWNSPEQVKTVSLALSSKTTPTQDTKHAHEVRVSNVRCRRCFKRYICIHAAFCFLVGCSVWLGWSYTFVTCLFLFTLVTQPRRLRVFTCNDDEQDPFITTEEKTDIKEEDTTATGIDIV